MKSQRSNAWALLPIKGWREASNRLDTLLYYEFAQAAQRRCNQGESRIQSARLIRASMLDRMNRFREYGACEAESERCLMRNICGILKLSESCFFKSV